MRRLGHRGTSLMALVLSIVVATSVALGASGANASTKPTKRHRSAANTLSGTWSGQYGGSYNGTFRLHWQQSGSKLSGSITISKPASTMGVHGTVSKGSIQFGTVGAYGITYTGSVSGGSMSGNYKVGNAGGGPWSAHKTS